MIAAEEPTDIVINGSAGAPCAMAIDFGDGTRSNATIGDTTPFPLKIAHTYPKMADVTVRVSGAADGSTPACDGQLDAAVHVSPAGSKIEFITLSTSCPEGWKMVGDVAADKSFSCTPIPESNAPTNLIHCVDGMKYFAQAGRIGCRHPAPPPAESFAKAKTPKGTVATPVKSKHPSMPLAKTPPADKAGAAKKSSEATKAADGAAAKTAKPASAAKAKSPL